MSKSPQRKANTEGERIGAVGQMREKKACLKQKEEEENPKGPRGSPLMATWGFPNSKGFKRIRKSRTKPKFAGEEVKDQESQGNFVSEEGSRTL